MNRRFTHLAVAACALLVVSFGTAPKTFAKQIYKFGGGPAGSDFLYMAGGVASDIAVKKIVSFRVLAGVSEGSLDNLKKVDAGHFALGVVYSGDLYLGRRGLLENDPKQYTDVLAVSSFFASPVQLVVKKDAGIQSAMDLVGKSVGVGTPGSEAMTEAQRFFHHLGIWNKITRSTMNDSDSTSAFDNNRLDALWLLAAVPSDAVTLAAQSNAISLIDVLADSERSGFLQKYPYFSKMTIPAGIYPGIDQPVGSIQESVLWVANDQVPAAVVYALLSAIYSPEGLAHMAAVDKIAQAMRVQNGIQGITTAMHPGAIRFWKENGVLK